jgi:hypothetical protein
MIRQILSNMIAGRPTAGLRSGQSIGRPQIFGNIFGIKHTFIFASAMTKLILLLLLGVEV